MDVHDGRGKGEKRGGVGFLDIGPCFFPSNSQTPIQTQQQTMTSFLHVAIDTMNIEIDMI